MMLRPRRHYEGFGIVVAGTMVEVVGTVGCLLALDCVC